MQQIDVDIVVANAHGLGEYCDVKKIPVVGETVKAYNRRFEEDAGKGTNVAVAIGRLGGKVAFLGKAGVDEGGRLGEKWMREANVDLSHYWLDPNVATDLGLCIIAEDGNNLLLDFDNDENNLQILEIDEHLPAFANAHYLTSGFSIAIDSALYVCQKAKEMGMYTLLNASPMADDTVLPAMPQVDVLLINETEAKILLQLPKGQEIEDYMNAAKQIWERYKPANVVITLGEDGSLAYTGADSWEVAPTKVKMVDQTGAGDGFLAAVTWKLSQGKDLKEAMKWASVYSAYLVTQFGSLGTYPKLEQIDEIFESLEREE